MEQNLSEKERKVRLAIGITFAIASLFAVVQLESIYLGAGFGLAALGFIVNYFTCFCGTKKFIKKLTS